MLEKIKRLIEGRKEGWKEERIEGRKDWSRME